MGENESKPQSPDDASTKKKVEEDPKLKRLQVDHERLKVEKDNAQLRQEIAAMAAPWWQRSSTITTLGAFIAVVIPATTAVQGYFEKSTQLALQSEKQKQDLWLEQQRQTEQIRTAYLDRTNNDKALFRTLRFLAATSDDRNMREWANSERDLLNKQLEEWQAQVKKQEQIADGLQKLADKSAKDAAQKDAERLAKRAADAKKRLQDLRANVDTLQGACNCTPGDPLCSCL
jgi:hypothetical protein